MATASPGESSLECPICNEDFDDAKILPCAHLACKKCVLSWLRTSGGEGGCPLCRAPILPSNHSAQGDLVMLVDALPTNFAVMALVESQKVLTSPHVCNMCNKAAATVYCMQCNVKLCGSCVKSHNLIPSTKNHKVEDLEKLTAQQLAETKRIMCKAHPDRLGELYCPSHKEVVCLMCVNTSHESCTGKKSIADAAAEKRAEFKHRTCALRQSEATIAQQIKDAKNAYKVVRKRVKDTFDDIQNTAEKRKQELEREIQAQEDAAMTAIKSKDTTRASLASNANALEQLVSTAPQAALLAMVADLTSRLDQLQSHTTTTTAGQLQVPEFTLDVSTLRQLKSDISSLGRLKDPKPRGAEFTRKLKVGDRVKPRSGMPYGLLSGKEKHGTVTAIPSRLQAKGGRDPSGLVDVRWDGDVEDCCHRMGYGGWYDIVAADLRETTEQGERDRLEKEHEERREREKTEQEERDRLEEERRKCEKTEQEERDRLEKERREREKTKQEERDRLEEERRKCEKTEQEERDRLEKERREREKTEQEERDRLEEERREREETEQEERDRLEEERREREETEHRGTVIHEIEIALRPTSPSDPPEQSAQGLSQGRGSVGSLPIALQKDRNVDPRNIRESYSASRYTQTPGDPDKRSLPKPIFCHDWSKETRFDQAGGILHKPNSEVVLNVPRGSLDADANIYMSICTDVARIHQVLKMKDIYIASPVAEFWTDAEFQKPVQICLPHCLSLPGDSECLQVFRISRTEDGEIAIQRLKNSTRRVPDNATLPLFNEGTFDISSDDERKVYIKTTCFSGYVVVRCPYHAEENCELHVLGCGMNNYSAQSGCSNGYIKICVWDKRLEMEDFRPEDAVTVDHRLELPASFNDRTKDAHLSLTLRVDSTEPPWAYCGNSEGPLQTKVQKLRLKAKQCCGDGSAYSTCRHQCQKAKECRTRKDIRKDDTVRWQLKTLQPSPVPPWLRCTVEISYVDDSRDARENDNVTVAADLKPVVEETHQFKSRHQYSGAAANVFASGARPKKNSQTRQAGHPSEQSAFPELMHTDTGTDWSNFLGPANLSTSEGPSVSCAKLPELAPTNGGSSNRHDSSN